MSISLSATGDRCLHGPRIATGTGRRLGHGEARADLTSYEAFEPTLLLGIAGHLGQEIHVALVISSSLTDFEGPARAFATAFDRAGISANDLDFAEIHDCFTIAELLVYEAMGLAPKGAGATVLADGIVTPKGDLPINLSGGLKSKGHPVGATGVSMHVMTAMQLAGEAGELQKENAELGCVFNMGGSGVANYCSVLERRS